VSATRTPTGGVRRRELLDMDGDEVDGDLAAVGDVAVVVVV
jgi:hypothetical protein